MSTRGFADLLRYATLDGGNRISLKPNGLLACLRFRGPDAAGANPILLNDYESTLASALERRGSDWCYHITIRRGLDVKYPTSGAWPSPIIYALDYDRGQRYTAEGQHLPTVHHLWISYFPNQAQRTWRSRLNGSFVPTNTDARAVFEEKVSLIAATLKSQAYDVERLGLSTVDVDGKPVVVSDLLAALYAEVNLTDGSFAVDIDEPLFLDSILAPDYVQLAKNGRGLVVNGERYLVATVWGFPHQATSALFTAFGKLPVPSRYSARIIPLTAQEADRAWDSRSRKFLIGMLDISLFFPRAGKEGAEGPRALREQAEAARTLNDQGASYSTVLYTVVARCSSDAVYDTVAQRLATIQDTLKVRIAIESGPGALSGYLGGLPGEPDRHSLRRALMRTVASMKLAPVLSTYHGESRHPHKDYPNSDPLLMLSTPDREPYRLYLHVGEVGHTVIYGKTGLGKSVLLRAIETGHLSRYPDGEVSTLDIGFSALKLALAARGHHLVASLQHSKQFAYLAGVRDAKKRADMLEDLRDLIELWTNREIDLQQYKAVEKALERLAVLSDSSIFLSALATMVQDTALRDLFGTFKDSFLDGHVDTLQFDASKGIPYWVIEYGTLGIDNTRWVSPFIALVQRKTYEAFEERPKRPRLQILDEFGQARRSRRVADLKERMDLQGRKHMVSSVVAAQTAKQVLDSPISDAIIEMCSTRISFRNPLVVRPETRRQYLDVGFTEEEVDLLPTLGDHDFLVANEKGHQVVQLNPTDFELAIYGGASDYDRQLVLSLREQFGSRWLIEYLKRQKNKPDLANYAAGLEALDFQGESA